MDLDKKIIEDIEKFYKENVVTREFGLYGGECYDDFDVIEDAEDFKIKLLELIKGLAI